MKSLKIKLKLFKVVLQHLTLAMAFLLLPVLVQAQTKSITGSVSDDQNDPLSGAIVTIKGSKVNTLTDGNGKYKITAAPKDQLVFSYIGFENAVVTVGTKTVVNASLKSKTSDLDEVVVIGYGTVKRKDLTGSVGTVAMEDISKAPVRSFDEALAGRVAGVQVNSADGQPGSGVNIVIRGNNSVTQNNSPLYVVDGFLIENPDNNVINPADIATMDILKDASATAIYGARGANGVIVITTKKGKEGKAVFAFSSSTGVQDNINPIEMMSPYEFVKYQLDFDPSPTSTPFPSPTQVYLFDENGGPRSLDYYKNVKGIDWQRLTQRTAIIQNNSLSVSGGTKKFKYAVSGSTIDQDGIILNSNYKRYQGRVVLDYKINDKFKVGVNANYSYLRQTGINPGLSTGSATTNIMVSVWGARPVVSNALNILDMLQDPDINSANDYRFNPVINLTNIFRQNNTKSTNVNTYLEYQILKTLRFRTTFGINENRLTLNSFNNSKTQYGNPLSFGGASNGINGSVFFNNFSNWLNENTLTWDKRVGKKSKFNVVGGFTNQKRFTWSGGQDAIRLPNEDLGIAGLDQGVQRLVLPLSSVWTMSSFLGRVNYSFNSKYTLTASMRADGSSKFPSQNHWGYFPSAAASWTFAKESFLKNIKVVSDGKLRMSYGVTGNNRVGDFDYLTTYFNNQSLTYTFDNNYQRGVTPIQLGNSNLKWESTEQFDAGLDIGLFKQRITLTADVYLKTTKDLLLNTQLSPSSGFSSAFINIGRVENRGLELTLNSKNITTKNFSWTSNANISFNQNKLLALAEDQNAYESRINWDNIYSGVTGYIAKIGQPLGQMYGFESLGTYKDDDFDKDINGKPTTLKAGVVSNGNGNPTILASPGVTAFTNTTIKPGDVKYKDQNGDGIISANDYTTIGRGLPIHTGGFSNNFTYKNFDLNVFFQWSYGNDILNANNLLFNGNAKNQQYLNQYASNIDRWTETNRNSDIPRARGYLGSAGGYTSAVVEDGSYLRLKTVSFGYNISEELVKKLRLISMKFHLSGQNLITWTKYSGSDPEVNTYNSALTSGFDFSSYPRARTIVFGTNITF